ncbi:hypothetical protein BVC93_12135 [Mycobacterium sp. MS1601]|uniref:hypothetical protein n=1 Tax=Mycobacterium sp. MS1601 TaxID=1936029 RepID=UPI0009794E83|nr:hypothetical protein [Mycobacterium sp. MS1601]AQA03057.1 hypothetical protein BVC93_12135 [Mycobacterium sp. MS1601]
MLYPTNRRRRNRPAHAARPPLRVAGALAGLVAIVVAVVVAVRAFSGDPAPAADTLVTARSLTVTIPQHVVPLTADELADLQTQPPDLGVLAQPARLSSCLAGLGYPSATEVLGARPVEINGRPAVVLLLAADDPALVTALAVTPQCSVANTGLLADTTVPRTSRP